MNNAYEFNRQSIPRNPLRDVPQNLGMTGPIGMDPQQSALPPRGDWQGNLLNDLLDRTKGPAEKMRNQPQNANPNDLMFRGGML